MGGIAFGVEGLDRDKGNALAVYGLRAARLDHATGDHGHLGPMTGRIRDRGTRPRRIQGTLDQVAHLHVPGKSRIQHGDQAGAFLGGKRGGGRSTCVPRYEAGARFTGIDHVVGFDRGNVGVIDQLGDDTRHVGVLGELDAIYPARGQAVSDSPVYRGEQVLELLEGGALFHPDQQFILCIGDPIRTDHDHEILSVLQNRLQAVVIPDAVDIDPGQAREGPERTLHHLPLGRVTVVTEQTVQLLFQVTVHDLAGDPGLDPRVDVYLDPITRESRQYVDQFIVLRTNGHPGILQENDLRRTGRYSDQEQAKA